MAAAGIAWRRPFGLQGCSPVYSVILHLVEVSVNSTVILRGGTGIARGALLGVSARLLALLLGNLCESNFRRALSMSLGDYSIFLTRPITVVLLILTVLSLVLPAIGQLRKKSKAAK